MYRVAFQIVHHGCWATDLSASFPNASIVLRESVPLAHHARDIICMRTANEAELQAAAAFLARHPGVRGSELLDADRGTGFFMVEGSPERSIIDVVTQHRAFRLTHSSAERGREHWNVGIASKERIRPMLDAISELGELEVKSVARASFPDLDLSPGQRQALRTAITAGYYNFPRKTSPTQLATHAEIAKSTLLEHLRKAEAKVILSQDAWI